MNKIEYNTEKLKSLVRFMTRSTRYKDVFDIYFLKSNINKKKLKECIKKYIYDDETLAVNNIEDIVNRLEIIFSDKIYISELNKSRKNWLEAETGKVLEADIELFKNL